jgi:hypothetical protein
MLCIKKEYAYLDPICLLVCAAYMYDGTTVVTVLGPFYTFCKRICIRILLSILSGSSQLDNSPSNVFHHLASLLS